MAKTGYGKTWEVPHMPAKDWMCWNAVLRLTLPVMAAVLVMILALQGLSAGTQGVEDMLKGPLLMVLTGLLAMFLPILWLVFLLQGEDVLVCTVDNQGVHVRGMLPCAGRMTRALPRQPHSNQAIRGQRHSSESRSSPRLTRLRSNGAVTPISVSAARISAS